jgi:hypothetical protein
MSYEELGADQFELHRKHTSRYKDGVTSAVQCNTHRLLLEYINPLTPELNPSVQGCLTRFFTGDFAS